MEPTIYKPSIYKGAGIYKIGAEGGGGGGELPIELKCVQGSRSTPDSTEPWPEYISVLPNRVTTQYLEFDVGTKLKFICNKEFSIIDGTTNNQPFTSYSWTNNEYEIIVEHGILTVAIRNSDNSNLLPIECVLKICGHE